MSQDEELARIYNEIGESFYWEGSLGENDPVEEKNRQKFVQAIQALYRTREATLIREAKLYELNNIANSKTDNFTKEVISLRIAQLTNKQKGE